MRYPIFLMSFYWVVGLVIFSGCVPSGSDSDIVSGPAAELNAIVEAYEDFQDNEFPRLGVDENATKLPQMTESDILRRTEVNKGFIERLEDIDVDALTHSEQITHEMLCFILEDEIAQTTYRAYLNPILVDAGFHIGFSRLPQQIAFRTEADYVRYLSLLEDFPRYAQAHVTLMRKGLAEGIAQPKVILAGYEETMTQHVVDRVEESLFYKPFLTLPSAIDETRAVALRKRARTVIKESVGATYAELARFFTDEYIPNTRTATAAYDLPDGKAYYQQRIRYYTTLDLTPDEIFNQGLSEVARIRADMQSIMDEVNFKGDIQEFLRYLRTDARFYPKSEKELLHYAAYLCKEMEAELPKLFDKLPRQPCAVRPVPAHLAPKYTAGRYVSGNPEAMKPGQYWVNTYQLSSRPLYTLPALTLHEAVPGHHLQEALTREIADIPHFRQHLYLSAFGEGWGLYSEYLGIEAGIYKDPYSNFGRLTYEMWRACRLVVDVGLHAKGWTRQQAMDYMAEHTALSLHEIRTEVDRYISWPAQALSYKIGELTIRSLRKEAENALGEQFDVRAFHNLVLSQGTVTLPILKRIVRDYITQTQKNT